MSHTELESTLGAAGLDEAETALAAGDVVAALAALESAAAADPDNDDPPLLLAMLHLRRREFGPAATAALRAIEIRPFHPRAWNLVGAACLEAGDSALARDVLTRARRMAPSLRGIRSALKQARRDCRQTRGRRRADAPDDETPLPLEAIRARLEADPASLTVAIDTRGADDPAVERCRASFAPLADAVHTFDDADARDLIVGRSRHAWLLFVGAEERLADDAHEALMHALRSPTSPAWAMPVRYDDHTTRLELRLVRNAPGIRFGGVDRPTPLDSLRILESELGIEIGTTDATLDSDASAPRAGAGAHDVEALEAVVLADPDSVCARLELADALIGAGRPTDALRHTGSARATLDADRRRRRPAERDELALLEGLALMRLERSVELAAALENHHASFNASASTAFLAGYAAKANNEPERAAGLLESAVDLDGHTSFAAPIAEVCGPGLFTMLGAVRMDLHDTVGAREAFDDALLLDPEHVQARLGRIAVLRTAGELEAALTELDALVAAHGDSPSVWLAGSVILESIDGLAEASARWLESAHERIPEDMRIVRRLGDALLRCGRGDEALVAWSRLSEAPGVPLGTRAAAALVSGSEMPVVPLDGDPRAAEQLLDWFECWARAGAIEALDRALIEIDRVERVLPGIGTRTAEWLEGIGQNEAAQTLRARL